MKENSYEFELKAAKTPPQETMKSRNTDLLLTSHSDPLPKLENNDISKQNQPTTKLINFRIFFLLENLKQKLNQTTQIFLIHITESKL
jgi:hypothetical protein